MKRQLHSFFVLIVLLGTGCASSGLLGSEDPEVLDEMKDRIVELQKQAAVTRVEITRLQQRIVELEARHGGTKSPVGGADDLNPPRETTASSSTRPPSAPPLPATDGIEESDLEVSAPSTPSDVPSGGVARPEPIPQVPSAQAGSSGVSGEAGDEADVQREGQPVEPAAQALYDRGYTLYHQGRYVDAEASFQRFLQNYPNTGLADNAQYWIGESRYARGDFEGALVSFRETLARFPSGNKVPNAMLKAGQCLEALGDSEGARVTYAEIGRRFPETAAAAAAEERLTALP